MGVGANVLTSTIRCSNRSPGHCCSVDRTDRCHSWVAGRERLFLRPWSRKDLVFGLWTKEYLFSHVGRRPKPSPDRQLSGRKMPWTARASRVQLVGDWVFPWLSTAGALFRLPRKPLDLGISACFMLSTTFFAPVKLGCELTGTCVCIFVKRLLDIYYLNGSKLLVKTPKHKLLWKIMSRFSDFSCLQMDDAARLIGAP